MRTLPATLFGADGSPDGVWSRIARTVGWVVSWYGVR